MTIDRDWFARARVGLFTHYTYPTGRGEPQQDGGTFKSRREPVIGDSAEQVAAGLDPELFAEAAVDLGAEYVVFTMCHAGFNLLFPSETMKRTGLIRKASETDLIAGLLGSLGRRGLPLVLYLPPNDNHDLTLEEIRAMGWDPSVKDGWFGRDDGRERFINDLLGEVGERYAGRIAGFWFDQGGPQPSARERVLRHNPNAVLFVNAGITGDTKAHGISDFIVSEYYDRIATDGLCTDGLPTDLAQVNRVIGGSWWACGRKAATSPANLYRYTVRVAATEGQQNGGVNWSCGPYMDNTWEDGVRELMHGLGEALRARGESIYGTVPGRSYVTPNKAVFGGQDHFVSTEAPDGARVYLHFLRRPDGGTIALPGAADGKRFASARLLVGRPLGLRPSGRGYDLAFGDCPWDDTDTVVVLGTA